MIFVVFLPGHWTSSHSAQHVIVAAFYAVDLIALVAVRSGHRFTYLNHGYSIAEALLARHLPGDQPPAFVGRLAPAVVARR
jgi:hypothetical protein